MADRTAGWQTAIFILAGVLALLQGCGGLGAPQTAVQENAPVKIWYKLCTAAPVTPTSVNVQEGGVCQTMVDVRDNAIGLLRGRLAIWNAGQGQYRLQAILPLGSSLPAGALVKIDDREPIRLSYKKCDSAGCYAEAAAGEGLVSQMKSGSQIAYLGIDVSGKTLSIPLPLPGFAAAFDGPPMPVSKYKEDVEKIAGVIKDRLKQVPATDQNQALDRDGHFLKTKFWNQHTTTPSKWYKLCLDAPENPQAQPAKIVNLCLTQIDIRDNATSILAGKFAVRQIHGKEKPQLLVMLPLGVSLPDGASVTIGSGEPIKLSYSACDKAGCYAEATVEPSIADVLKANTQIAYAGKDEKGTKVTVPLKLSGFASAFDGPPVPIETYNAEQRKLAEFIRAKLEKQPAQQGN